VPRPGFPGQRSEVVGQGAETFGPREAACALTAAALGGHVRVGFENNLLLPDGTVAPDNAALVRNAAAGAALCGRGLASADAIRAMFAA